MYIDNTFFRIFTGLAGLLPIPPHVYMKAWRRRKHEEEQQAKANANQAQEASL